MASPVLGSLQAEITRNTAVDTSARLLIDGFQARLDAGIADAIARGASEAEMAGMQAFSDELKASSDGLAASVAANTPAA